VKVDVVFSEPHYARHMMQIWAALPRELQGVVHPAYRVGEVQKPRMGHVAMVAGWQDVAPLRGLCNMIYVEHGAGQTYADRVHDPSYSGSRGQRHQGVIGYVAPSTTVAERWDRPAVAAGCPKMDRWLTRIAPAPIPPGVCFAWHWDCTLVPETRSAWAHYLPRLTEIVQRYRLQGFVVYGHAHPKWYGELDDAIRSTGMTLLPTEDDVFTLCDVLLVDNSSLAYEFALLGRPVLALNAPWYRRDIEHGLRFWSHVPGLEIDDPEQLLSLNLWDLIHDTPMRGVSETFRTSAVEHAYEVRDGTSSKVAAAFIAELIAGM
jgi:hypothetical protein